MSRLVAALSLSLIAATADADDWRPLLDADLTQWEVWTGVPHTSVPIDWDGKADNVRKDGEPLGLRDPGLDLFTVEEVVGEPVLRVSGQVYAGLTTREEFEDYHLSLEVKWGETKWAPRKNEKRDSGLLYHCVGRHGAFWQVWMRSLECQIQEGDFGDFIALAGTRVDSSIGEKKLWDPDGTPASFGAGGDGGNRFRRSADAEKPHGEWNVIDLYVIGDVAVHAVNGVPVLKLENARERHAGGFRPLTRGKIQLQSEGAELFYRRVKIRPLAELPDISR